MKRALLIATGTVGGLGAVLAVTPPQFTSSENTMMALPDATTAAVRVAVTTPSATAAPGKAVKPSKATKPTKAASSSTTPVGTPTPVTTTAEPFTKSASGTFTGDSVNVRYGNVQVKIIVENGLITDAQAVQSPSGRNDRWTQMSVPVLRQRTLAAQSANISGVSGASFTSYGWYTSLVSALAKAGM